MTIEEIFDYVDEVKPNNYSKEIKTHWLNELEGKIQNEIMLLAQPEYISYVYRSSTELSGLSFPNDHTLLLPRRIKAHVGGELELNGLTLYAANNLKGLEILSISSDGKHLSFAEGSFTATGSAGDSGTLMFDGSSTTPLIKFPFDRIYASWLIMKVSEHLEESSQFANSAAQFRDDWNGFAAWYADTYRPADGAPTFKGYYLVGKQGDPGLPGKDGSDGITPMIGENGNWYFGEADTGKPSRGVPGAKGDKGDPGAAATIEIGSVTTVDAGTDAEVSNSGTQGAALFNFKIPKGEKGDPGEPALLLHGTVSANNEIIFDPLPDGQNPYSAATAAHTAGRLVQIDATDASGNWNTILTLSRVGLDELQFFNYEETESDGEQRLQLVKMLDDSSATYSYIEVSSSSIEVPTKTSQLINDSGFLTSHQDISGKQDKATLEADVAAKGFTKNTGTYSKPAGGIPKADLAAAVQTSLDKADSALQSVPSTYRTAAAQDVIDSGKVDKVDGKGLSTNDYTAAAKAKVDALALVATSGSYNDLTNKPTIPTAYDDTEVRQRIGAIEAKESSWDAKSNFSGNYNDLTNKPTIPAPVTEQTVSGWGFTKNTGTYSKPTGGIPKADLAAAVQTSLGKADSALQSVPSTYRTAAAQDAIDSGKVDKVTGKGLSTNDYTAAAKAKVDAIPTNPKYTDTVYDDTALKERVATIEGKESTWDAKSDFSGSYNDLTDKPTIPTIPEYVRTEAETVARIVNQHQSNDSIVFPFLSDSHCGYYTDTGNAAATLAGQLLNQIGKRTPYDFIVHGGDFSTGAWNTTKLNSFEHIEDYTELMSEANKGVPSLWCAGNHDDAAYQATAGRVSQKELFGLVGRKNRISGALCPNGCNYGYMDLENRKLRVIYLDTDDKRNWGTVLISSSSSVPEYLNAQNVGGEQLRWLANVGLDFAGKTNPAEWSIVVVSHAALNINGTITDAVSGTVYAHSTENAAKILNAYRTGKSGSITHNGITVNYNFATVESKATVICAVHGHNHKFSSETLTGGILSIGCPNVMNGRERASDDGNTYTKTAGTANGTSFCILTIDMENHKIYADCVGAGYDREFTYTTEVAAYTNQIPISTNTDGSVYGYKAGYRLSSSGAADTQSGSYLTGFIPIAVGDTVYMKNVTFKYGVNSGLTSANQRVSFYNASKTHVVQINAMGLAGNANGVKGDDGIWTQFTLKSTVNNIDCSSVAYFRLNAAYIGDDSIITVNEPIG